MKFPPPLFLPLLLAVMVLIPMASADVQEPVLIPDAGTITIPDLQFDPLQEKVNVTGELSPVPHRRVLTIPWLLPTDPVVPYGAIIHHSKTGVTTVFDATGRQLFAADDAAAATVTTPHSEAPGTFVHEIPSGSVVTEDQGNTTVFYQNARVLTIINEHTNTPTPRQLWRTPHDTAVVEPMSLHPLSGKYLGWLEYAQSTPVTIDRFESIWTAPPSTPLNTGIRESLAIWNGIEREGIDGVMQPILMWNFCPYQDLQIHNEYKGAAWDYHDIADPNKDSLHSPPINVSPADAVRGILQWSSTKNQWKIEFKNTDTGQTTEFYTNRFPHDKLVLYMALEAATPIKISTNSLTGPISFSHNTIKYHGSDVAVTFTGHIHPDAATIFPGLSPRVTTNPLKVELYTGR